MSPHRPVKTIYQAGRIVYRSGKATYLPVRARNGVPMYDFFRQNRLSRDK